MTEIKILGIDLYHIMAWLMIYSVMGWIWESTYVSIKERKPVNRGFVTGPVCTIYGVGAVTVYLLLKPLSDNLIILYLGGVIVPTILEYITSFLMERMFHTSWWDYSNKKFNIRGRICLGSSLAWGFFTIIMFHILHPFAQWLVSLVSVAAGQMILMVATVLYAADFGFSMATAMQLGKRLEQMEQSVFDFLENIQSTKAFEATSDLRELLEVYRHSGKYLTMKERMERLQEMVGERFEKAGLYEQKAVALEKLHIAAEKVSNVLSKGDWNSKRLLQAYPNLGKASGARRKFKRLRAKRAKKRESQRNME